MGKIDILCNCAGIAIRKNIVDLTEEEWDLALDVTLKGIYLLSREVVPHMIRNGRRQHHQHRFRMVAEGAAESCSVLRGEGRRGESHTCHGH